MTDEKILQDETNKQSCKQTAATEFSLCFRPRLFEVFMYNYYILGSAETDPCRLILALLFLNYLFCVGKLFSIAISTLERLESFFNSARF